MWLLSSADAQASVAQFFRVRFGTFTNVATDLIALSVGKVAGYTVAGRLSIAQSIVLPPLEGALFWWSLHRRVHWWMLSFGLLAWGSALISAFLNFQIGVGLALLFAAAEPALRRQAVLLQIVARAVLSAALLLAHPFGLLFYALLLGALAIGPTLAWREWRGRGKQPIETLPRWDAISEPDGGILNDVQLLNPVIPVDADTLYARYSAEWRRFDYLLVVNADIADEYGPFVPPSSLTLVRDTGFARLYKIAH